MAKYCNAIVKLYGATRLGRWWCLAHLVGHCVHLVDFLQAIGTMEGSLGSVLGFWLTPEGNSEVLMASLPK